MALFRKKSRKKLKSSTLTKAFVVAPAAVILTPFIIAKEIVKSASKKRRTYVSNDQLHSKYNDRSKRGWVTRRRNHPY